MNRFAETLRHSSKCKVNSSQSDWSECILYWSQIFMETTACSFPFCHRLFLFIYFYSQTYISSRPCVNICVRPSCFFSSESAIFKLIAYPRSKVKEVKELLFQRHLRLIKTQTDEKPRHSKFLSPFLHSSKSSPAVDRWLISKKSRQK